MIRMIMTSDHSMHICKCKAIHIDKRISTGKLIPVPKVKSHGRDSEDTLRIQSPPWPLPRETTIFPNVIR